MLPRMIPADRLASIRLRLPRHAVLLESMARVVAADDRWRFLELGCSLGAGSGDDLSDVDAGVGYEGIPAAELYTVARGFAEQIDTPIDLWCTAWTGGLRTGAGLPPSIPAREECSEVGAAPHALVKLIR